MTTAMFKTGMNRALLNQDFFQAIIDRAFGPNRARTTTWSEEELDSSASILSNISSGDADDDVDDFNRDSISLTAHYGSTKASDHVEEPCPMNDMTGHFLYRVEYQQECAITRTIPRPSRLLTGYSPDLPASGSLSIAATTSHPENQDAEGGQLWVVIKSKPIDTALIELTNIMAQLQGGEIAEEYDQVKDLTGFRNSHIREIELAQLAWQVGGAMERISTKVYNVLRNDSQQLYALCLEYLNPAMGNITHMNSTDTALSIWSADDIHLALRELASFHAQFLGEEDKILDMHFLENPTRATMNVLRSAYEAMVRTNRTNDPGLFTQFLSQRMLDYLAHSDEYWATLERTPRTLIHGDFNTRNICLRLDQSTGAQGLCAYDWELACCHVPQRDVVEFLSFVLPPGSNEWSHYIEYHRLALQASFEKQRSATTLRRVKVPSSREYYEVAKIALMDFAALRVAMYGISNSFKQVDWLPRILSSVEEQLKRMGPPHARHDRVQHQSKL
ncbi:hypothetical protein BGX28_009150 [Mortierella sp. GBA30]|nr:hypothetical protein BGX28_009150 [Mortierella sp. GBA30]